MPTCWIFCLAWKKIIPKYRSHLDKISFDKLEETVTLIVYYRVFEYITRSKGSTIKSQSFCGVILKRGISNNL
jgi:hypothetical protein